MLEVAAEAQQRGGGAVKILKHRPKADWNLSIYWAISGGLNCKSD